MKECAISLQHDRLLEADRERRARLGSGCRHRLRVAGRHLIAAKDAKFSDGHAKIGIAAGTTPTILWPLLCGMARAKYFLLLAEPFTGEEAANMGIVSLAVDGDQLQAKSVEIATRLALQAPGATGGRRTRSITGCVRRADFRRLAGTGIHRFRGPEGKEGMDAFCESARLRFPLTPTFEL